MTKDADKSKVSVSPLFGSTTSQLLDNLDTCIGSNVNMSPLPLTNIHELIVALSLNPVVALKQAPDLIQVDSTSWDNQTWTSFRQQITCYTGSLIVSDHAADQVFEYCLTYLPSHTNLLNAFWEMLLQFEWAATKAAMAKVQRATNKSTKQKKTWWGEKEDT